MYTYTASPQKLWILDSGVSSHMTDITQKFVSLNMSTAHPSIKIADDTYSPVLGNRVVQVRSPLLHFWPLLMFFMSTTPSWPLLMFFMFHVFLLVLLLPVSLLNKITVKITFFFLIVCFRTCRLRRELVWGMSEEKYTIWMIEWLLRVWLQVSLIRFYCGTGAWVILRYKRSGLLFLLSSLSFFRLWVLRVR